MRVEQTRRWRRNPETGAAEPLTDSELDPPLLVRVDNDELEDFQRLINRGLNCWAPEHAPKWVWQLDAAVQAKINDLKREKDHERAGDGRT